MSNASPIRAKLGCALRGDDYIFAPRTPSSLRSGAAFAGQRPCASPTRGRNSVWLAQQGLIVRPSTRAARVPRRARWPRGGVDVDYRVASVEDWPDAGRLRRGGAIFVQFVRGGA